MKQMLNRMLWGAFLLATVAVGCNSGDGSADKIVRVSRQNNSGTYAYFREAVLGKDREFQLGSVDQSGSKDVVELVAKTPNAIGYSGMGYATEEVKMLSVSPEPGGEAIAPTVENAKSGAYPLARNLYIYTVGEPQGAAKHYIDWIQSEAGQKIVTDTGYVPVEAGPATEGEPGAGSVKIKGSDTMVNLAQAWAEAYGKLYPSFRPEISGGGSGTGIAGLIDGTVEMANASREMKPAEKEEIEAKHEGEQVNEVVVAMDALAVYVHPENKLDAISIPELAEIYGEGGTIENWSQLDGWPTSGE